MDCFGTYFTHVQKALLWTWQPAHMEHTKFTAVRLLKTCTWQPAHMEHTKYTAVRTKVYIQQNHSACTDEALGRVQMRPLTACTDEAVTLATLARTIRVYLRPWPRTIRVYLRPQKARAQPTPWSLNQPPWKICSSNWESFPQGFGMKWKIFELPPPSIQYKKNSLWFARKNRVKQFSAISLHLVFFVPRQHNTSTRTRLFRTDPSSRLPLPAASCVLGFFSTPKLYHKGMVINPIP